MEKRILHKSIITGLVVLFAGCMTENPTGKQVSAVPGPIDTVAYKMTYFKDFSPYFSADDTKIDSTIFSAHYPVFDADIDTLVKRSIFIDGEEKVEQVAESFIGGFNEYAEEQIESGNAAFHAWFKHQDCRVILNVPGFLTLQQKISDYTGGAHGMEVELWFNFDTQAKKQLYLRDIVQDTAKMRQIAEHHFKKQEMLSDTASYGADYFFEDNVFSLAENFGLTQEGILFHYNPYEIKSYAEGPTTLLIPYSDLEGTLTEKGEALLTLLSTKD